MNARHGLNPPPSGGGARQVAEQRSGTLDGWGVTRADRLAEYAALRAGGCLVHEAARRAGVCGRTAARYEAELAGAGQAPWRAA